VDFSQLAWTLSPGPHRAGRQEIPAVVIGYGDFINTLIQFVIVAFAIFIVVKAINRLSRKQRLHRPHRPRKWCCCARSATA
jgi:large conductance mechanosensitive channel